MLVLSDLAEMWRHPIEGEALVAAKGGKEIARLCTSVWDCEKARPYLPSVQNQMGTQLSHKYSIPRLQAAGQKHWFDGALLTHPRQDLTDLFDQYYQEALAAGYRLENYAIEPFGPFPKKSQANYTGNDVTRVRKQKSWVSRTWKDIKESVRGQ
ncbi:hypothetical protein [Paralysiella testudinis]|uniref:Uncharacterized protein n=1 Tax=Paralysiella testudinis TaxID=2809020 RepID=A0A892ZFA6_9NEIS|nr:hypothetical protein [Paralysiella testudinis]QRQ82115.1 hypothetical protein JQU52_01380 [Paralysiella testudinis]